MTDTPTLILGLESSCDETAAALVRSDRTILAEHIASSADQHAMHGGVVPEIAARQHLDVIDSVIEAVCTKAGCSLSDLDGIAATGGPGLIGGVLVGTMTAKAIASALDIPYFAINHLEGHALTARLTDEVPYPYLLLLVSGGHTQLLSVLGPGQYQRLGTTMDDAAGEAFDKGAAVLGLGYPGGPAIEAAARSGNPSAVDLPRPRKGAKDCHFSFSGLKTALAMRWAKASEAGSADVNDFAASLQKAITDCLSDRVKQALIQFAAEHDERRLVIAGGVAANQSIGNALQHLAEAYQFQIIIPPPRLCTDNGAMIAWAGHEYLQAGKTSTLCFAPRPRWPLDEAAAPPPGRGVRG
ncbi:metalloendopeptidase, putative, glycoprotease family [SAR116 cluster alpha proteobacterium HIMB100]|nr:metalloendopeptidase, putative, glycoprotease family [SAR116 cluster alpha proteobacterium HIMB100]